MGAWGEKIYQDDVACDVKEEYLDLLRTGLDNEEATSKIIEDNEECIKDIEDGPIFWFALADTQWNYGKLLSKVKKEAINAINDGIDLERWKGNDRLYSKRKKVLEQLKDKLNSEQPAEKKFNKLILNKAKWKIGDVLLYKLTNDLYKDTIWYQKYVLFGVLDISKTNIGSLPRDLYFHEQDIIGLYNWIGSDVFDIKNISNLIFISKNNFLNQNTKKFAICSFTAREIEKLKIELLGVDEKLIYEGLNLEDKFNSTLGISWINKYNFDQEIINWLIEAKKDGYLIEDI